MALSAGSRLGPYEILAPIGAGGMGEVYRARDTKLQRDVAIKVLPDVFADDPARMARFEREARVLASLNHPHIAAIYGVEDRALVMEFVDGAQPCGPLGWEEAWKIASQIAVALEYAHEKGIVHRDLKPANIKLTADGQVKVLDFGLAKALEEPAASQPSAADSPTVTMPQTLTGVILGTAGYMAPEQARGKPVDKRADIWSFGVVLYELLTGRHLFEGETVSDKLAQVLTKEPDWNRVPVPARTLLRRCLEKDPKLRLRDAGDARLLIIEGAPVAGPRRPIKLLVTVAAVLAVIAAVSLWGWWRAPRSADQPLQPLARFDVDLGSDVALGSPRGTNVIISPYATRLVYVSQNRLFTRRLDQTKATELAGTEGAEAPFFSPDGKWVAFFTPSKLKKISPEGGAAIDLCAASNSYGGSWGEDGSIIAALNFSHPLSRLPAAGGVPGAVTELAQGEIGQRWPQILPGGKAVLFTRIGGINGSSIEVLDLRDRRRKTVAQGIDGRYLPASPGAGYLLYVNRGSLFALPFDPDRLEIRGTPVPMVKDVSYTALFGAAQYAFARNGTLVYGSSTEGGLLTLQWLESAGNVQPLLAKPGAYGRPRLSPDGRRVALEISDGSQTDIWAYDVQRETMTRLSFGRALNVNPIWTPDGRYIVFSGPGGMFWTHGAGNTQPLTRSQNQQFPFSFSPDGKWMAFYESGSESGRDLWVVPVEEDGAGLRAGKPEVFLQTPFDERSPVFAPDGRWLAYASDESGRHEVYVRAFARAPSESVGKWQVSNNGGDNPEWSRNGRELFFHALDDRIMVAGYTAKGDSFAADKPRVWSEKRLANTGTLANYDVAPDGKRVLALMPAEGVDGQSSQHRVIFLVNFLDELRRRVPVGK